MGNDGENFKTTRTDEVQAPMDFAIVTGWQVGYIIILSYDSKVLISDVGNHESHLP